MRYSIEKVKSIIHYMWGLSLVGFILRLLLGSIAPPAMVSIITFGLVIISLLISMFLPISLATDSFNILHNIPVIFTILLAIWTLVINANYYDRINDGNVAEEFYRFSLFSLFVMICQVYVSFASITAFVNSLTQNDINLKNASMLEKSKMNAITYLITPLNIVLLTIMNVILEFFSTDG